MGRRYKDNALTTLASSITAVSTTLTVATGKGDNFPAITGAGTPGATPNYFVITLEDASANREKIRVEHRAAASDVLGSAGFPLVRGYDGTTARAWNAGDSVDLRMERVGVQDVEDKIAAGAPGRAFGVKDSTTAGLNLGLYGGTINVDGTPTLIADLVVALTASQTNYVERTYAGAVSANTVGFSSDKEPLWIATTNATEITALTDKRSMGESSFLQTGTGAKRRSLIQKAREIVSVKDFGAVGDGVTDDTAAMQAALTAAAGKTLYGADASYRITAALNIPSDIVIENVRFVGHVSDANLMTTTSKTNITFRNCRWSSAGTYSAVSTFTLCNNVTFEGCIFNMAVGAALNTITVRCYGCVGVTFRDCQFYDSDSSIYLDLSGGTYSDLVEVLNCYFEQVLAGTSNNPTGVYQLNCKRLLVDGCAFKNIRANGGAPIAGYSVYEGDGATESLIVTNCTTVMDHGGAAKAHVMVQNSNAAHCRVEGNRLFARAIGAAGSNYMYNGGATRGHVQILGNYAERAAILVTGGATAATGVRTALVHENTIYKCEQNTENIRIGVTGSNYVDYASVKDNTCYNGYAASINISETNYAVVEGNRCMNWNSQNKAPATEYAYTAAIYWLGTVKAGIIRNNRIENNSYVAGDVGFPQYAIVADASAPLIIADDNNIVGAMTGGNYVNIVPTSGTYMPVATLTANLDAATPSVAQFSRQGSAVTVSGHTTIDPTAAGPTATVLGLSIPIASNFTNSTQAGGSAHSVATQDEQFVIYADAVNDRVTVDGLARSAAAHDIWYHYSYQVP